MVTPLSEPSRYEPFLLPVVPGAESGPDGPYIEDDWTEGLDLDTATAFSQSVWGKEKLRVLVLYGSLRERSVLLPSVIALWPSLNIICRSFSKLMALEAARLLHRMGCEVRVYDPQGLPVKDGVSEKHEKVQELRSLSEWSDGQLWSCPEQHGAITGVFKTQSTSNVALLSPSKLTLLQIE